MYSRPVFIFFIFNIIDNVNSKLLAHYNFYLLRYKSVNWIQVARDKAQWQVAVKTGVNLRVAKGTANILTTLANISFRGILLHEVNKNLINYKSVNISNCGLF